MFQATENRTGIRTLDLRKSRLFAERATFTNDWILQGTNTGSRRLRPTGTPWQKVTQIRALTAPV